MIEEFKDQKEVQLIVFQLGNEEYGVPITCVQEIIMVQESTRIPKSPAFVEGVINLRGHIIPVIDGKKKFQLENKTNGNANDARIIVLEVDEETIGLIVDSVSEVIHLKTEEVEPPPIDMGEDSDYLWGVGKYQNRLLILINPQKFLTISEAKGLQSLSKVTEVIKQVNAANKAEAETKA